MFFVSFLFFLIGILSGIFSPFFFFLLPLPFSYLFFYRKIKGKRLLVILFSLLGFLLAFFYPKGNIEATTLKGICIYRKDTYFFLATIQGRYLVYDKENTVSFLSIVRLTGTSSEALFSHHESGFDFREYLKGLGVEMQFTPKKTEILFDSHYSLSFLKSYLGHYLKEENALFARSLLFGDSLYSHPGREDFEELNLTSMLSLSGFHLSFLFTCLEKIAGEKRKRMMSGVELILLGIFLILSQFRYSIRRIFLSALLRMLNYERKWGLNNLDRVSLIAFLFLCLEPFSIRSASFYYPFPLLFFLSLFPNQGRNWKSSLLFFLRIFAFYFPFRLLSRYSFSLVSPFVQVILVPYSHLLFLFSLLALICPFFGFVLNPCMNLFLKIASFSSSVSYSLIGGKPSWVFILVYYLLLIAVEAFRLYRYALPEKKTIAILFLFSCSTFVPDIKPHYEITFIDVAQGDATLIRYRYTNILIDTGGNIKEDFATECLIPYFHKRKIRKLDAVLITHEDYDHCGALPSLQQNFKVDRVYYAKDFLESPQDTLNIDGVSIRNLNSYGFTGSANDGSAVYDLTLLSKRILIMGDAPKKVEKRILSDGINVDCDILKVGHHGSKTSSDYEFIQKASPDIAIISVGVKNKYGLPDEETLTTLKALKVPYRRTDLEGTITLSLLLPDGCFSLL